MLERMLGRREEDSLFSIMYRSDHLKSPEGENAQLPIEAPPTVITAKINPADLAHYFNSNSPHSAMVRLYFTGGDYQGLTRSIDTQIPVILEEIERQQEESERRPTDWDESTLNHMFAADDIDQLTEAQREFRHLWDLRVAGAQLGLSFLRTLELPEDAERRYIREIERGVGKEGPQTVSPWARMRVHKAEREILRVSGDDPDLNGSSHAERILQLRTVRFARSFNALLDYYAKPPAKFSRHLDPAYNPQYEHRRPNQVDIWGTRLQNRMKLIPGEFYRAELLLGVAKRFNLWDQYRQINEDLGSPQEDH